MDKPVRGLVFAEEIEGFRNGDFINFPVYRNDVAVIVRTEPIPVLVVPIDDASVAAMVERACEVRFGSAWRTSSRAWRVCERAEMDGALRAALGIDGGTA